MNSAGSSTADHLVTDFLTGYLLRLCPIGRYFSTESMIGENHSVEDNHKTEFKNIKIIEVFVFLVHEQS
jgi:hypothetical protein